MIPYTIEEAYEVADAIERNDFDDLRGELGDLLLQVVFHSQIAQERGLFDFEQVAAAIGQKLVSRHPHVFAGVKFDNDEQRQQAWDEAKAEERRQKQAESQPESVLAGVAHSLPALVQCEKIQNRAASHGFDWPEAEPVFDKVREELDEVHEAWRSGDQAHIHEEVGDLLLVAVNLARHLKVNPEIALRDAAKIYPPLQLHRKAGRRVRPPIARLRTGRAGWLVESGQARAEAGLRRERHLFSHIAGLALVLAAALPAKAELLGSISDDTAPKPQPEPAPAGKTTAAASCIG